MTKYTNHQRVAESWVHEANEASKFRDEVIAQFHMARAQVHATLALVEQQRISTLFQMFRTARLSDPVSELDKAIIGALFEIDGDRLVGLRPEVAESLNIAQPGRQSE